jgi:hypothetical protein
VKPYNEEKIDKEDAELGRSLSQWRRARARANRELRWQTNPEEMALLYPRNRRSKEILGLEKWQELVGSEDD